MDPLSEATEPATRTKKNLEKMIFKIKEEDGIRILLSSISNAMLCQSMWKTLTVVKFAEIFKKWERYKRLDFIFVHDENVGDIIHNEGGWDHHEPEIKADVYVPLEVGV